ncbi:hypothetical protein ACWKWP_05930 [Agromyces soli]
MLESIIRRLCTREATILAWQDLEDAAVAADLNLELTASRARALKGCLTLRFGDAEDRVRTATQCLRGETRWAFPEHLITQQDDSYATRTGNALEALSRQARKSGCVAWLRYDHAQISGEAATVGHITLYNAQECGPRAMTTADGTLPHQAELHAVLTDREQESWWATGTDAPPSVIVRVDLGLREWHGGLEDAAADVEAMLAIASTWVDGIRWRRVGASALRADGRGVAYSHAVAKQHSFVDWMGIRETTAGLDEWLPKLDDVLDARPIPTDLRESARLLSEARLESSRESSLGAAQRVHERTALILRDQAFERIAAYAGLPVQQMAESLRSLLPYSLWLQDTIHMVDDILRYSRDSNEATNIRKRIESRLGPDSIDLIALADAQKPILALCSNRVERLRLRSLMRGLTEPRHYLQLSRDHADRLARMEDRHRRVRNAIAHGNPVTAETVRSVLSFGETRATVAMTMALRAFTAGQSLEDHLREQVLPDNERHQRLSEGHSWLDIWKRAE